MGKVTFGVIIFILFFLAIRIKISLKRRREMGYPENAVDSLASLAIGELVAVAGGIYVSLLLLSSFLEITMPERMYFYGWSVDYLAAIAIILALIQPIILSFYYKISGKI
jgi:hypothetical protein